MRISFQAALLAKAPSTWLIGKRGTMGQTWSVCLCTSMGFAAVSSPTGDTEHGLEGRETKLLSQCGWWWGAWSTWPSIGLVMGCMVDMTPYRVGDRVHGPHTPLWGWWRGAWSTWPPIGLVTGCVVNIPPVEITQITTTNKHEKNWNLAEIAKNVAKRHEVSKCYWKTGAHRLAQRRVATNLNL